jgi:hypothetical protein
MAAGPKEQEVKAWQLLLEDDAYRLDCPDDFYKTLIARADDLVLRQIINLAEWQQLKDSADAVYGRTLEGLKANQPDCIKTLLPDLALDSKSHRP